MTLNDAVQQLLQSLGTDGDSTIPWAQVCRWPKGAIENFQEAGWLLPVDIADTVECHGCEENCTMPVEIFTGAKGQPNCAFIACEDRNFGRVKIPLARLQQWQLTQRQIGRWIADTLSLRFSGRLLDGGNLLELGLVRGRHRTQMLCLHVTGELVLVAGSNRIPLLYAIQLDHEALSVDADLIRQLVDNASTGDARYTPNTARREVRKLDTAALHEEWRKEYRALKNSRPNMSDVWYSKQIAKMECAHGRKPETIRRQMKK